MTFSNSNSLPEGDGLAPVSFNSQGAMSLAEILQMCCTANRSGQISFRSGDSTGYIYLQHGHVLHSACGGVEGPEAVYRMLAWPPGTFVLDEGVLPHRRTVQLTWEQLLFEGARRADTTGFPPPPSGPVVTAEPVVSTRARDSQPKLTVILPDQRPMTFELEAEYTHVGRAPGNELPLLYPSVSNRHCMFILTGTDVVLRDLNSSNGTVVNGETISEVILRPGDIIQLGVVQIKFEPGVRRPKLSQTVPAPVAVPVTPAKQVEEFLLRKISSRLPAAVETTVKLPTARKANPVTDDSAFVKGEAPISYDNLPKPEVPGRKRPVMVIVTSLILVLVLVGAGVGYWVLVLKR